MITSKFVEISIKEKLKEVFHIIDQDKNGKYLKKLTEVFHMIDQDKNGKIYFADIQRIGRELNVNFKENEIQDMVDEADRDRKFGLFDLHCRVEFEIFW
ncbi:probable calcium-binding protein CML13 isoform X2 [Primulina eburnea]|uniref:probable calcium-binding protein CML13 isoform X2 n=1 Tax=Primulina eburnea TaxID=1245227 RepID=UPI003C6BDA60